MIHDRTGIRHRALSWDAAFLWGQIRQDRTSGAKICHVQHGGAKLDHEQEKNNTGIFQRVSSKSKVQGVRVRIHIRKPNTMSPVTLTNTYQQQWPRIMFSPCESVCHHGKFAILETPTEAVLIILTGVFYPSVKRFLSALQHHNEGQTEHRQWRSSGAIFSICLVMRKWISLKYTLTLCGLTQCQAQHNLIACKSQETACQHRIIWMCNVTSNQG